MRIRIKPTRGGGTAQLVRERYDPARGRGRQEVVATVPVNAVALPSWLTAPTGPLTPEELTQLRAWHAERLAKRRAAALVSLPTELASQAEALAAAVTGGHVLPDTDLAQLRPALARLLSLLPE